MEVTNMNSKDYVCIESYSQKKLMNSYSVILSDWYENGIDDIDNTSFIKDNKIDEVKIFCEGQLYINRYNNLGLAYSFDTYDEKNKHIDAERVIYNGECMIGNMEFHIGDEIEAIISIFDRKSKKPEKFTVKLKYECASKTINTYTYCLYTNKKLNVSFSNKYQNEQKCTITINKNGTNEAYVVDIEL